MTFTGSKGPIDIDANMRFRAPFTIYMTFDFPRIGDVEALVIGTKMYMGKDGDWAQLDTSNTPFDLSALQKYAEDRGPVSYSDVIRGLRNLDRLEDEVVDGKSYWHFQGSFNTYNAMLEAGMSDCGTLDWAKGQSDTGVSILLDPETLLPRRYEMVRGSSAEGDEITMNISMEYEEYNQDVDIPDEPSNATTIALPSIEPTPVVTCSPQSDT